MIKDSKKDHKFFMLPNQLRFYALEHLKLRIKLSYVAKITIDKNIKKK